MDCVTGQFASGTEREEIIPKHQPHDELFHPQRREPIISGLSFQKIFLPAELRPSV
jgi:hypothetical protein